MRATVRSAIAGLAACSLYLGATAACAGSPPGHPGPEGMGLEPEEYAALSVLIDSLYTRDYALIVIGSRTEPWCIHTQLHMLRERWPDLKQETVDSLIMRNSVSADVAGMFAIRSVHRVVTESEYRRVLGGPAAPDWEAFDSAFVDAQGYLVVSRGGFDEGRTQALFYFSNSYRCSGSRLHPGTRHIAYLRREGGVWRLAGVIRGLHSLY